MMKNLLMALGVALLVSAAATADDTRTERVHFTKGATSATVEDTIKGYRRLGDRMFEELMKGWDGQRQ